MFSPDGTLVARVEVPASSDASRVTVSGAATGKVITHRHRPPRRPRRCDQPQRHDPGRLRQQQPHLRTSRGHRAARRSADQLLHERRHLAARNAPGTPPLDKQPGSLNRPTPTAPAEYLPNGLGIGVTLAGQAVSVSVLETAPALARCLCFGPAWHVRSRRAVPQRRPRWEPTEIEPTGTRIVLIEPTAPSPPDSPTKPFDVFELSLLPEPPVGIEPTTCSLRVNRSAD